jgi:sec-independent protein translocase protein TatA
MHILFISGSEIFVVLFFILIFFGAKSIPDIARVMGKGMREFNKATQDIKKELSETTSDIRKNFDDVKAGIEKELKPPTDSKPL